MSVSAQATTVSNAAFQPLSLPGEMQSQNTGERVANNHQALWDIPRPRLELQIELTESQSAKSTGGKKPARWIVFDPLTRQSFRIGWLEHWMLTRINGRHTIGQLFARFQRENPTYQVSDGQLLAIYQNFCRCELVRAAAPRRPAANHRLQEMLSNMVAWQIRGIHPDRLLDQLAPHVNLLFSRTAVQNWLLLALMTICAVLLDFQRLTQQSQIWDWFIRPSAGGMLLGVFLVTRAFHEFGHAVVCKRFGVRCPDIGVFLILGAPCVYCDVSDSWKLPSRWKRAAVAAAGMYVELITATLAAWVWLLTIDGPINTLALQTMFVCSISTVVINANPLMRFDGYYMIADWLDEVNLRSKADSLAMAGLLRFVLGTAKPPAAAFGGTDGVSTGKKMASGLDVSSSTVNPAPSKSALTLVTRSRLFIAFSIAGWTYRAILSITIATILISIYSNWNLIWFGRLLAAAILVSWWGVPAVKLFRTMIRAATTSNSRIRLAAFFATLVFIVGVVPVPQRKFATGWVQPRESQGVFAKSTARLVTIKTFDGDWVDQGDSLFELEPGVQLLNEHEQLQSEVKQIEVRRKRVADLIRRGLDVADNSFDTQSENAQSAVRSLQQELDDLTLKAPARGRFCAAVSQLNARIHDDSSNTVPWTSPQLIACTVPKGTRLGTVFGDETIAVVPLTESQLASIAVGTPVRLGCAQADTIVVQAVVDSIVQFDQVSQLWHTGYSKTADSGASTSGTNTAQQTDPKRFAAVISLPDTLNNVPGSTIDAVFVAPAATLASLATRWLKANLRFFAD